MALNRPVDNVIINLLLPFLTKASPDTIFTIPYLERKITYTLVIF